MRSSYALVLESDIEHSFIKMIEFVASSVQAEKVFNALSFALCDSEYTKITLFSGEKRINTTTYKR